MIDCACRDTTPTTVFPMNLRPLKMKGDQYLKGFCQFCNVLMCVNIRIVCFNPCAVWKSTSVAAYISHPQCFIVTVNPDQRGCLTVTGLQRSGLRLSSKCLARVYYLLSTNGVQQGNRSNKNLGASVSHNNSFQIPCKHQLNCGNKPVWLIKDCLCKVRYYQGIYVSLFAIFKSN